LVADDLKQTIQEMALTSSHQDAVAQLHAEAHSVSEFAVESEGSETGVQRLVGLLNKVLRRLERQVQRRKARMLRTKKSCKLVRNFISTS
jgi:ribosome-associated translation inhibitor RaiA